MGVPAKLPRPGMSGMIGMALTPIANTTCLGFSLTGKVEPNRHGRQLERVIYKRQPTGLMRFR